MSVGREFWEEKKSLSITEELQFIAENYRKSMKVYKLLKNHNRKTYNKKVAAHKEMQKIRDRLDNAQMKKIRLPKSQLIELERRLDELEIIREEDDLVIVDGQPLKYDQLVQIINKRKSFLRQLEKADSKVRPMIADAVGTGLNILFCPVAFVAGLFGADDSIVDTFDDFVEEVKDSIKD